MPLRDWIPEAVIDYVRQIRVRLRYPGCTFRSYHIGGNVALGREVKILRDAEVHDNVSIGDHSYINAGTVIGSGSIGKFCSIGYACQIGMAAHPVDFLSTSSRTYGADNVFGVPKFWEDFPKPPRIGNDVWIGSHAIVLQGVVIGDGAIVAAGAVVTRDVAPFAIVAGVPAKEVRKRFDAPTIARLLELRWWDLPPERLRRLQGSFKAGKAWPDALSRGGDPGGT